MKNLELIASRTVDQLIMIKDRHRDILMADEINTLNRAANLLYKNRKELKQNES
jgi:hypothetical protein